MAIQLIDLGRELENIPIDTGKVPYTFSIKLEDLTYKLTIKYNEVAGFFTVDLSTITDKQLCFGDPVRYGRPLFGPIEDERFPLPVIIPTCPGGGESEVTWDNLGDTVNLYLFPREGFEDDAG